MYVAWTYGLDIYLVSINWCHDNWTDNRKLWVSKFSEWSLYAKSLSVGPYPKTHLPGPALAGPLLGNNLFMLWRMCYLNLLYLYLFILFLILCRRNLVQRSFRHILWQSMSSWIMTRPKQHPMILWVYFEILIRKEFAFFNDFIGTFLAASASFFCLCRFYHPRVFYGADMTSLIRKKNGILGKPFYLL